MDHHDAQFTEGRLKYRFLHQSRTGLNLDAYVVSACKFTAVI